MNDGTNRTETIIYGVFSLASVRSFLVVYGPSVLTAPPGSSFRAMSVLPVLALVLGFYGWRMRIVAGIRQLFRKPRLKGCVSITVGMLHFVTILLFQWLLMDRRGIEWGS